MCKEVFCGLFHLTKCKQIYPLGESHKMFDIFERLTSMSLSKMDERSTKSCKII